MGPSEWIGGLAIAIVVLLLAGLGVLFLQTLKSGEAKARQEEEASTSGETQTQRDRRRGHDRGVGGATASRLRERLRRRRGQDGRPPDEPATGSYDEERRGVESGGEDEMQDVAIPANRQERLAQRRAEEREAREEARRAERAQREAQQEKRNVYEERRRQKEAEREERERQEEEERLRAAEERRKKEEEEAAKWAEFITEEERGEKQDQDEEGILKRFVDTIKERKSIILEELAAEFEMRTQEVIQRVQDLEKMGRITGVMDDRGKFIYISLEEMEHVASFIKSQGRVAISELARRSNAFIDLESKVEEKQHDVDLDLGDLDEGPGPVDVAA